jgi:hypothetical protein
MQKKVGYLGKAVWTTCSIGLSVCFLAPVHGENASVSQSSGAQDEVRGKAPAAKPNRTAPSLGNNALPLGTLDLIRKQADLAKNRAVEAGQKEAESEVEKANNQARALQERAERQAREAAAARGHVGSEATIFAPQEQIDAARSQAALAGERLKEIGKLRAEMEERQSREKAEEIERQAQNLQDQLLHERPSQNQEIRLNPVGTNLYVRNYLSVPSKVAPLHARAASINDGKDIGAAKQTSAALSSQTSSVKNLSSRGEVLARPDNLSGRGVSRKTTVKEVKGQVLKP